MNTLHDAMAAVGLTPHTPPPPVADGKLQRFRVAGDKAGSKNGWVIEHTHPVRMAVFGSWKTGEQHTWREASITPTTPAQRAEIQHQLAEAKRKRDAELFEVQCQAQDKAAKLWKRARPADNHMPYLVRKRVGAYGIRRLNHMLLIPARDVNGVLRTLQFIGPDGSKRFLTGGRIAGCYCAIGQPVDSLLVAEGYATGATLFAATGRAVAVCFSAGNMLAVARDLRAKFPDLRMIMCADDDFATPGNPGLTAANKAAQAVGGVVAVPRFEGVRHA
ncbi:MAG: toprim domain-containing protein [Burkholderiaceae bacterium]|nr:toprim domain-containing protein [Burkholderiaceae bacterium]